MAKFRQIAILLLLLAGATNYFKAFDWQWKRKGQEDWVDADEKRYALIKDLRLKAVGYGGKPEAHYPGDNGRFRLLQYAIAPTLVSDRADQDWLVWDGEAPSPQAEALRGFVLRYDLGNGVRVYQREAP